MVDWDDIRIFVEIARSGSINGASRKAKLTQPTISRRIQAFEQRLGVQLFRRLPNGVSLTSAGTAVLERALEMERAAALINAAANRETSLSGVVRLWVSDGIGGYWLPPLMSEFHRRFPAIMVEVHCSQSPPDLSSMETDIVAHWRQPPDDTDILILAKEEMTLRPCASQRYLAEHGFPKSLSDLQSHRICDHLHYPRDGEWQPWTDLLAQHQNVCYRTNSSLTLGEATIHGVGVSLQPVGVVDREPTLVLLDIGFKPTLTFWLVCHRQTRNIPRMKAIIDHLQSSLFRGRGPGSAFLSGDSLEHR
jgi:DNA-binding transcriptional LysR family regulator